MRGGILKTEGMLDPSANLHSPFRTRLQWQTAIQEALPNARQRRGVLRRGQRHEGFFGVGSPGGRLGSMKVQWAGESGGKPHALQDTAVWGCVPGGEGALGRLEFHQPACGLNWLRPAPSGRLSPAPACSSPVCGDGGAAGGSRTQCMVAEVEVDAAGPSRQDAGITHRRDAGVTW